MESSLEDTIRHYLNQTFRRDASDCHLGDFHESNGHLYAEIVGRDAEDYKKLLDGFLSVGYVGLNTGRQINRDGKWDYRWRFFLSHGLGMLNHYTVQLMHFPPDYVMTLYQDHMEAGTTRRWTEILDLNGAPPEDNPDKFQTLVDILPIAAPSNHGSMMNPVIDYFTDYAMSLLNHLLVKKDGVVRPLVVFGSPARTWLGNQLGLTFAVGEVHVVTLPSNISVPLLVANHPSYFYNAMAFDAEDPTSEEERHLLGVTIMEADLVAGSWQVQVGLQPSTDPVDALTLAEATWLSGTMDNFICKLVWIDGLDKTEAQAEALCHKNTIYLNLN